MGELRHRDSDVPLRRCGPPLGVDELLEARPGEPGAAALLVGVVAAIVFILILAVWRRRRRESEREDESDETPTELSQDRRDRDPLALQWKEPSNAET